MSTGSAELCSIDSSLNKQKVGHQLVPAAASANGDQSPLLNNEMLMKDPSASLRTYSN